MVTQREINLLLGKRNFSNRKKQEESLRKINRNSPSIQSDEGAVTIHTNVKKLMKLHDIIKDI